MSGPSGQRPGKWPGFWFISRVIFREDPSAVHARYRLYPMQEQFGTAKLH